MEELGIRLTDKVLEPKLSNLTSAENALWYTYLKYRPDTAEPGKFVEEANRVLTNEQKAELYRDYISKEKEFEGDITLKSACIDVMIEKLYGKVEKRALSIIMEG